MRPSVDSSLFQTDNIVFSCNCFISHSFRLTKENATGVPAFYEGDFDGKMENRRKIEQRTNKFGRGCLVYRHIGNQANSLFALREKFNPIPSGREALSHRIRISLEKL